MYFDNICKESIKGRNALVQAVPDPAPSPGRPRPRPSCGLRHPQRPDKINSYTRPDINQYTDKIIKENL